jgi:hypothetical protein
MSTISILTDARSPRACPRKSVAIATPVGHLSPEQLLRHQEPSFRLEGVMSLNRPEKARYSRQLEQPFDRWRFYAFVLLRFYLPEGFLAKPHIFQRTRILYKKGDGNSSNG